MFICTSLTIHHKVQDLRSIRKFWSYVFLFSPRVHRNCYCISEVFFYIFTFWFLLSRSFFCLNDLFWGYFVFFLIYMMLVTSSSPTVTPFRYRASRIWSCCEFSLCSILCANLSFTVFWYSLSNVKYLPRLFVTVIHALLCFMSFPVVDSISSSLRNLWTSSSHLLFVLVMTL